MLLVIGETVDWHAAKKQKAFMCQACIKVAPIIGFNTSVCMGLLSNLSLVLERYEI